MNEVKFGRILETGMGAIMSLVLSFSAQVLLGAPITIRGGFSLVGQEPLPLPSPSIIYFLS